MLSSKQIQLVEESWDFVILNTQQAGVIFYDRLFEIAPQFRSYFKEDINSQSRKLVALISFAVHKLGSLDQIVDDVKALGERHRLYKVKDEDYAIVGNALLWTLEKALGNKWDAETKEAWVLVYTILSQIMIEASNKAANSK